MNERLARFYQLETKVEVHGSDFRLVKWPDNHRGGVIGMGAVLAMTSHYSQTSPVLRGAWALETLLGTPVPPPPPDVPPLDNSKKKADLTVREKLELHRASPSCSACHKLMDPIGFALENFDWMGRWRDNESNGKPLDISGVLPSGDKFDGPAELRLALQFHDVSGAPEWNLHQCFDPARLCRHDHDAVAENDGFIDAVGDENDGLFVLFPDLEKLFLKQQLVLRVQCGERFVHQ